MVSIWEFPKIGDPKIVPEIDPQIRYPLIFGNSHIGLARNVGECRSDESYFTGAPETLEVLEGGNQRPGCLSLGFSDSG